MSTFLKYKLKYDVTVYDVKINTMSPPRGYRLKWTMLPYTMLHPFHIGYKEKKGIYFMVKITHRPPNDDRKKGFLVFYLNIWPNYKTQRIKKMDEDGGYSLYGRSVRTGQELLYTSLWS